MIESAVLGVRYGDRATNLPVAAVAARCQCRSIDLRQSFIFQFEKFLYSLTGTFLEELDHYFAPFSQSRSIRKVWQSQLAFVLSSHSSKVSSFFRSACLIVNGALQVSKNSGQ